MNRIPKKMWFYLCDKRNNIQSTHLGNYIVGGNNRSYDWPEVTLWDISLRWQDIYIDAARGAETNIKITPAAWSYTFLCSHALCY